MKKILILSTLIGLFSCSNSKQDASKTHKKLFCGDSVEQKMYDKHGEVFMVKVPGKCDTVISED